MQSGIEFSIFKTHSTSEVVDLFLNVFTESENESEGEMLADLVSDLIKTTSSSDLRGYVAVSSGSIIGCIFFSRFIIPGADQAFLLSPVAISTDRQGCGIGKQLINHGLHHLKVCGVHLVFTYGDPNFYSRVGFKQIGQDVIPAPFELSQPQGWMGQSLDGKPIRTAKGPTRCVNAFNNPGYW